MRAGEQEHVAGPPYGHRSADQRRWYGRYGRYGRQVRIGAIALAVLSAVAIVGVGTAQASGHGWWRGHGHSSRPTGASGAAPTRSVPDRGASASPTAGTATPGTTSVPSSPAGGGGGSSAPGGYAAPPVNAGFDYQIGTPYTPPAGVGVVSRDHGASPVAGKYTICYVNAFQAQPEAASWWQINHNDLLLKSGSGYVVDGDWNEILLDVSTSAKRAAILTIVGDWINECASKGFRAVEPDNLDSWTRSRGLLTRAHAVAFAQQLVAYAHGKGLAVAQKNTVELGTTGTATIGFDFAIAEECADYGECQGYTSVYGDHVIVIEYDSANFRKACGQFGARLSIVQRDVDVTAPGSSSYVYNAC